jgi:hypothetical protein
LPSRSPPALPLQMGTTAHLLVRESDRHYRVVQHLHVPGPSGTPRDMLNVASFYSYGLPVSERLDAVQLLARLERAVAIADYPDARYVTVDRPRD